MTRIKPEPYYGGSNKNNEQFVSYLLQSLHQTSHSRESENLQAQQVDSR